MAKRVEKGKRNSEPSGRKPQSVICTWEKITAAGNSVGSEEKKKGFDIKMAVTTYKWEIVATEVDKKQQSEISHDTRATFQLTAVFYSFPHQLCKCLA